MIRVTWEWLGQGEALDLANTVTITNGVEHDLLGPVGEYERWARAESAHLPGRSERLLLAAREDLLELRPAVRDVLAAVSSQERLPSAAVKRLNRTSRAAPRWVELDLDSRSLKDRSSGRAADDLLARYARSAMDVIVGAPGEVVRCPAPSCGMFYLRSRAGQRWCSTQCGTRARVARHYATHRDAS
jgi:predicted RNA-binding Zn ribbon-like protein